MLDALHGWADAHRFPAPSAPEWIREPIPVVDNVDLGDGRRSIRVVGGSVISPAEWIARRAVALGGCLDAYAFLDATCGRYTVQPISCHVRTCPDCEGQRQARAVAIYTEQAAKMADPRFVTLTIRNVPAGELRAGIRILRRAVSQLLGRGLVAGGRCRDRRRCGAIRHHRRDGRPDYCDRTPRQHAGGRLRHDWRSRCEAGAAGHRPARGGLVAVEITWNPESSTWHPHAHVLLDGPYLPWSELRAAWLTITTRLGRPSWIVDVRRVVAGPRGMERAIREVVKYATKPGQELVAAGNEAALAELLLALRGQRLVSTFGSLYGIPAGELEPDEPEGDTVTISHPDDPWTRFALPRICPHFDDDLGEHVAAWEMPELVARADARRIRAGPDGRTVLSWPGPA